MDIHVDLVPAAASASPSGEVADTCTIVIDVLRSATVAALLFERGASSVRVTSSVRAARALAEGSQALLIGERDGVPPEGFNHGTSPSALRSVWLDDRDVVLLANDSPSVLAAASGEVWLAGLTNAVAVVDAVIARAPERVRLVCAGDAGGPDLADTVAAGLLVAMLDRSARLEHGIEVVLAGAAGFCLSTLRMTKDPLDGLWASAAGATLRSIGLEEDLAIASAVASSDETPRVASVEHVSGKAVVRLVHDVPAA